MINTLEYFVNRESELKYLEDEYHDRGFKLIVVYGRRRVGKIGPYYSLLHGIFQP